MKVAQGLHQLYFTRRGGKAEHLMRPWDELAEKSKQRFLNEAAQLVVQFEALGLSIIENQHTIVQPRIPVLKIGRKKQIITVRTE
jgi:hypothetical protein